MTVLIYGLDAKEGRLVLQKKRTMTECGFTEPHDLEVWLASAQESLFGRRILWIARQDRPATEYRSDLVGIDENGDLLVVELKRGRVDPDAVTQVLSYAAEYVHESLDDLVALFASQLRSQERSQLVAKPVEGHDAAETLQRHLNEDADVNVGQVLILLGEDYSPGVLAIADYLNSAADESRFTVECWAYSIFEIRDGEYQFVMEQVVPASSVRDQIEEKRSLYKSSRKPRAPAKIAYVDHFMRFLESRSLSTERGRGASYQCQLWKEEWGVGREHMYFSVHTGRPSLVAYAPLLFDEQAIAERDQDVRIGPAVGRWGDACSAELLDVSASDEEFNESVGDRLFAILDLTTVALVPE